MKRCELCKEKRNGTTGPKRYSVRCEEHQKAFDYKRIAYNSLPSVVERRKAYFKAYYASEKGRRIVINSVIRYNQRNKEIIAVKKKLKNQLRENENVQTNTI